MKEPVSVGGRFFFASVKLEISEPKKCMSCRHQIEPGPVICPHDPDRHKNDGANTDGTAIKRVHLSMSNFSISLFFGQNSGTQPGW